MGPKKDKKKKKPVSKRLAATNLSKKEIQAFINRHKAINQQNYGGGAKVSRLSKVDAKQYSDMRNYFSPAMPAPKTLNIPIGSSPKDFFLSEEAQRTKTIFSKLKEENAFRAKLREVELEEMKLKWEPTIMNYKEKIYEEQHALNLRKSEYNQKIEEMKHEKVLLDLAATEQTTKNKFTTERIKLANDTANHLKRNGKPIVVMKNGVKQYKYNDPNSLAKQQHEEKLKKLAIEAQEQDQQFELDKLKHKNEHNKQSQQIGGTILDAEGNVQGKISAKQSMLAKKQSTDTKEENVKQANYEYEQAKAERDRKFREEQAEDKWKPKKDYYGRQLYDPLTYKPLWEGTGKQEADVEHKEQVIKELTYKANQLKKKKQLERRLKKTNDTVNGIIDIDGHMYQNLNELINEIHAQKKDRQQNNGLGVQTNGWGVPISQEWHLPDDDDINPWNKPTGEVEGITEEEMEPYEEEWYEEEEDPYYDSNTKNQIRQQNAVNQLNHNIQKPYEEYDWGVPDVNSEWAGPDVKSEWAGPYVPPDNKQQVLHPETQVSINQPKNNGVNEQVAAAELQQAEAEAKMLKTIPNNEPPEWFIIEDEKTRNNGLYRKNTSPDGSPWDDFYKAKKIYAEQRLEQYLKTDEKDMADWDEEFRELLLDSKPFISGKIVSGNNEDEEAEELAIREHLQGPDFNKPYPNAVPPKLAHELLLAKIRNPKRELYSLMMDKKDKEIYFHELPELANSVIPIPLPNTSRRGNLAIGKKIVDIKKNYASTQNIDAELRTMFSTNLKDVLSIYNDPVYDLYDSDILD